MRISKALQKKCLELAGLAPATGTAKRIELPVPPSVNNLFLTRGNRRVKSPEYRAWLVAADRLARTLAPPAVLPTAIRVTVLGPLHAARDLDNMLKPIGDLLVAVGVLPDDNVRNVRAWTVEYRGDVAPADGSAVCVVEFEPCGDRP